MGRRVNIKINDLKQNLKYKVLAFRSFFCLRNGETKCVIKLCNPLTDEISETFLPNRYILTPSCSDVHNVYFIYRGFRDSSFYNDKYHHIEWEGDYKKYLTYKPKHYQ